MATEVVPLETGFGLPWVEKYRPETLADVVSHTDIIETIQKFIDRGQLPHLLLHGPPGTGKTSTIQAIARKLYGSSHRQMALELNASDDRGINVIREIVKTFAESSCSGLGGTSVDKNDENSNDKQLPEMASRVKLVILDEADHMTSVAQSALRRIMEKYAEHVRFCIICNYVNRINPAIQSRCTKFRFPPIPQKDMEDRTKNIAAKESVNLTESGLSSVTKLARGDMRKVLNVLQSTSLSHRGEEITDCVINKSLGLPIQDEITKLVDCLTQQPFQAAYEYLVGLLKTKGYCMQDVLTSVYYKCENVNWPVSVAIVLFPRLADIEYRLCHGANEHLQAAALVSCFVEVRSELEKLKVEVKI